MQFTPSYVLIPDTRFDSHFEPEHLADLRASGLDDETIRLGRVYSLGRRFMPHFFSLNGQRKWLPKVESGLCFPYRGSDFARLKLFPSVRTGTGTMKYTQSPGTSARLYVPKAAGDGRLIVTEGEKKTLSAIQHGMNAVGIGGVWNWVKKHTGRIDDLDSIDFDGRDVEIVPDSDVWARFDLMRPMYALGRELETRGAYVTLAMLPESSAGKVGLDDFFVAGASIEDFEKLERIELRHDPLKRCRSWYARWRLGKELAA